MLKNRVGRIPPIKPNWSSAVTAQYQFLTEIATSRDGSEQRWAHRQNPRVEISMSSMLPSEHIARLQVDVANAGQDDPFIVRAPWRFTTLSGASGASTLDMSPMPFWVVEGARLVVEDDANEEAVVVSSVAGTTATLTGPLTNAFAAGSKVTFAQSGLMEDSVGANALTSVVATGSSLFKLLPGVDPSPVADFVPDTYEGRDVFTWKPNWSRPIEFSYTSVRGQHDFGIGRIHTQSLEGFSRLVEKMFFSRVNRQSAEELLSFFIQKKGQRGSFYCPTRRKDMAPLTQANAGTSTLVIGGTDFFDAYDAHPVWNAVYVDYGTSYQVNRIVSMVSGGGNSTLTMADTWANDVLAGHPISWCPVCRFASDTMNMDWITDQVAETALSIITVKA